MPVYYSPIFLLILLPFDVVKALERKATKCNLEKMDSNKKRRKVDERLRTTEGRITRLEQQLADAQDVVVVLPEERVIPVRYSGRNRGIRPEFEAHVRCLMASGGSARQVRDNLSLNAGHFLGDTASIAYKKDIPTERWFSLQREALGVIPPTPSQTPSLNQLRNPLPLYPAPFFILPLSLFTRSRRTYTRFSK